jgi:GAF domain-containing protein
LDCFHSGAAVVVPDLKAESQRWPDFARVAESVGFASVHAVPMRLRDTVLGTLGLFGTTAGRLDDDDLALAQALVHVASVAIRIVLEQAKGVLASTGQLEMEDAFRVLRRYARDHGRKLSPVAEQLVNREMRGQELLDYARSAAILP